MSRWRKYLEGDAIPPWCAWIIVILIVLRLFFPPLW
jgi:hypothetical protein